MNHFFRNLFLSVVTFASLTLLSCGDHDDDDNDVSSQFMFIDHLSDATNIGSTSAFIPIQDQGYFEVRYGISNDLNNNYYFTTLNTIAAETPYGFTLSGLEPETTYYYTIVGYSGRDPIFSHQVKSFTTQGVGIAFIEPETVSMGNWDRLILRLQTTGIDDSDVPLNLFVQVRSWPQDNPSQVALSAMTTFAGNGIWKDDNSPREGDCYQAVVKTHSGRTVAESPVVVWTNGALVEMPE